MRGALIVIQSECEGSITVVRKAGKTVIQGGSEESVAQMKEKETILLSTYCILYVL